MRAFLDFEASSLGKLSYPIEVAWVFEDGRSETHLIKPAPDWTDWDVSAEATHGISRSTLVADGTPHGVVARHMLEVLSGHAVYTSAPSWDGKWLSILLRAAGLPRHAMRLIDSDEVLLEAASEALAAVVAPGELDALVASIIGQAQTAAEQQAVAHRALPDAERERQLWLEVRRHAVTLAARLAG